MPAPAPEEPGAGMAPPAILGRMLLLARTNAFGRAESIPCAKNEIENEQTYYREITPIMQDWFLGHCSLSSISLGQTLFRSHSHLVGQ
jgi:hypothetical protein